MQAAVVLPPAPAVAVGVAVDVAVGVAVVDVVGADAALPPAAGVAVAASAPEGAVGSSVRLQAQPRARQKTMKEQPARRMRVF
jgi:hypothetical protein